MLSQSYASTIKGGISYTVSEARQLAFENVPPKIDISKYNEYLIDQNRDENIKVMLKGKKKYKDRYFTLFSDKSYGIAYAKNINIAYYYNNKGMLTNIEYIIKKDYPCIEVMYDINGDLNTTSLTVSKNETFVFNLNKKLIAHWIGSNCYNENGELIDTRD